MDGLSGISIRSRGFRARSGGILVATSGEGLRRRGRRLSKRARVLKAAAVVWEEVDAVLGMAITVGRRAEAGAQEVGFLWQIVLAKG